MQLHALIASATAAGEAAGGNAPVRSEDEVDAEIQSEREILAEKLLSCGVVCDCGLTRCPH